MSSEPVKPQAKPKAGELLELALLRWARFRLQLAQWLQPENLQQLRPQVKFQAGVLAGFALLAAILLGVADLATRGVIELRLREDLQANLAQVVPAELHDNDLLQDSVLLDAKDNNLGSEQIEVYLAKRPESSMPSVLNSLRRTVMPGLSVWSWASTATAKSSACASSLTSKRRAWATRSK